MVVELVVGNILDQPVEVIVNSWNRNIIPYDEGQILPFACDN